MAKLNWDLEGQKYYEVGVDRGVLFPVVKVGEAADDSEYGYGAGVAWNGLTNVTESPSGAEPTALYANNKKYGELMSSEEFGGTIEAYTYPKEYAPCIGYKELGTGVYVTQQSRSTFGFAYRTLIGNDTEGTKHGYKIHLVYGAKAKPAEKTNSTINDSPEAGTMSWEFSTTPVAIPDGDPTAHIVIDSTRVPASALKSIEDLIYGTTDKEPTLPTPEELVEILGEPAVG